MTGKDCVEWGQGNVIVNPAPQSERTLDDGTVIPTTDEIARKALAEYRSDK